MAQKYPVLMNLRISKAQRDRWADAAGCGSVSAWLRQLADAAAAKGDGQVAALVEVRGDLRTFITQLKRIGTNVNQIAARTNAGLENAIDLDYVALNVADLVDEAGKLLDAVRR